LKAVVKVRRGEGNVEVQEVAEPRVGADLVVNIERKNPEEMVKDLTKGYGADVVLECSGSPSGAKLALKLVRKKGKFTQMGLFGKPIEIDFEQIAYN